MKIIKEARKTIADFWGKPQIVDRKYRLIKFSIEAACDDGVLLLNTVTGELVLLTAEEAEYFKSLPAKPIALFEDLIKHHFLVPDNYDEVKVVKQLRNIFCKINSEDIITGFSILPTTGCNARCFYCFEEGFPKETMTPELAEEVVSYIEKNSRGKKITINWFGGEPMVGHSIISLICDRLMEKNIEFTSSMISNGSLFNEFLAQTAKQKWHLERIQITLDGSEHIYNKVKNYKGIIGSPYYQVLDNVKFLLDQDIRVNVRLNMDLHNIDDIPVVIDELADRFSDYPNFHVYVHELFEDEGCDPVHHSKEERKQIVSKVIQLESYIQNKHFKCYDKEKNITLPALRNYFCMADNPQSVVINPLGQLGKCEHHLFKYLVGDIHLKDNGINSSHMSYWMNPEMQVFCETCALYPHCAKPITCDGGSGCSIEMSNFEISNKRTLMLKCFKNINND